jgi:hypothetical protein
MLCGARPNLEEEMDDDDDDDDIEDGLGGGIALFTSS